MWLLQPSIIKSQQLLYSLLLLSSIGLYHTSVYLVYHLKGSSHRTLSSQFDHLFSLITSVHSLTASSAFCYRDSVYWRPLKIINSGIVCLYIPIKLICNTYSLEPLIVLKLIILPLKTTTFALYVKPIVQPVSSIFHTSAQGGFG